MFPLICSAAQNTDWFVQNNDSNNVISLSLFCRLFRVAALQFVGTDRGFYAILIISVFNSVVGELFKIKSGLDKDEWAS